MVLRITGIGLLLGLVVGAQTAYAAPGRWTWMAGSDRGGQAGVYGTRGEFDPANHPGARDGAATWTDSAGHFWLFGGYGYDGSGEHSFLNDLWEWDGSAWRWVSGSGSDAVEQGGVYGTRGTPDRDNRPGSRWDAVSWTDLGGNLWLFGGNGYDGHGGGGFLNDLWKWDGSAWTWCSGSDRAYDSGSYGGPPGTARPGARFGAVGWRDSSGDLWLFGGHDPTSARNDLWRWDGTLWTWVSGSPSGPAPGVYGTQGRASSRNHPGARSGALAVTDPSGDVWLFGGFGYARTTTLGHLNDLWRLHDSTWTWVSGSNSVDQHGEYGTPEIHEAANHPGARTRAIGWPDPQGNLWIMGGTGFGSSGTDPLNDLWKWDGTGWAWYSGADTPHQAGVYGSMGVGSASTRPGAREDAAAWVGPSGELWLFGGYGYSASGWAGELNDMWKYEPPRDLTLAVAAAGAGSGTMIDVLGFIGCEWNGQHTSGQACSRSADSRTVYRVTATADPGSIFTGWTGCDSVSPSGTTCIIELEADSIITAHFAPYPTLTIVGSGSGRGTMTDSGQAMICTWNGAGSGGTCAATAPPSTAYRIVALAANDSTFAGWDGCPSVNTTDNLNDTCSITPGSDATVMASFTLNSFLLDVQGSGPGSGTMTDAAHGVRCNWTGVTHRGVCFAIESLITTYTLVAAPDPGSTFDGWAGCAATGTTTVAGDTCMVKVSANHTVFATFGRTQHTLAVTGAGQGAGKMTDGAAIGCAWDGTVPSGACEVTSGGGKSYTITATADAGSDFVNWDGCDSTSGEGGEDCLVTPGADTTVVAFFAPSAPEPPPSPPPCGLANCSFEQPPGANQLPDSWKRVGVRLPGDGTDAAIVRDGFQSFRFFNPRGKATKLFQDVAASGPAGDLSLSFWCKGRNVSGRAGRFRVAVYLTYVDGRKCMFFIDLPTGTSVWTRISLPIHAARPYRKLRVEVDFGKKGTAWFDGFRLTN